MWNIRTDSYSSVTKCTKLITWWNTMPLMNNNYWFEFKFLKYTIFVRWKNNRKEFMLFTAILEGRRTKMMKWENNTTGNYFPIYITTDLYVISMDIIRFFTASGIQHNSWMVIFKNTYWNKKKVIKNLLKLMLTYNDTTKFWNLIHFQYMITTDRVHRNNSI